MQSSAIGILGGSGLYEMDFAEDITQLEVQTPFGPPSSILTECKIHGKRVVFLSRHGKGHRIAPHEINHRANLWALKAAGIHWLICVTAVGSLREEFPPRHIVIPDQFLDRTRRHSSDTFFGEGIVAHVSMAEPTSHLLRHLLQEACTELGYPCTNGGTYVCMNGPAFSTRAESHFYRLIGGSVIGMTNFPEIKLARESEIAAATLAMVTDYDCWKEHEEPVTAEMVLSHLNANVAAAREILSRAIQKIPLEANDPAHSALDNAIITPKEFWPEQTKDKLSLLLSRFHN